MAPAGIAKGSFYAFFDSKESLYKDVMIRRAPLVARRLADPLAAPPGFASLVALMRATAEILTTDPLYRRLYTHPGELAAVARKIGPAEIAEITPHLLTPLIGYFARGQRDDVLVADIAPEVLVGVVRTVGLVVLEGDEAVVDATIRTLARGLLA